MIDTERIEELRHEIGDEDLRLVLDMFRDEAGAVIDRLDHPLTEAERMKAVHFLRSGALNLGLLGFAAQAADTAMAALEDRSAAADSLRAMLTRSTEAIGLSGAAQ